MPPIQRYFFDVPAQQKHTNSSMSAGSIRQTVCVCASVCALMQGILCGHISFLQSSQSATRTGLLWCDDAKIGNAVKFLAERIEVSSRPVVVSSTSKEVNYRWSGESFEPRQHINDL